MRAEDGLERPAVVTLAIRLFLGVVGIGIIQVVMLVFRHIDVRSPGFLIGLKLAIYAFSIFLLYQIAAGKHWARVLMIAIFVVAIPLVVLPTLQSFSHYPVYGAIEIVQVILYLVALRMLFRQDASAWFAREREVRL